METVNSWWQRLRSLRHGFWYGVSERIGWSRGPYRETPAGQLPMMPPEQAERIAALQRRYQIRFEARLGAATSLRNYEYLDILDGIWPGGAGRPQSVGRLCDVGSASFWYADCLQAYFQPRSLCGYEIEGYRLYRDGHSRIDYAAGYTAPWPGASLVVADYRSVTAKADVITAWFPFLTPNAILAWRLPLTLLAPQQLLARIRANLDPEGRFIMVNHGREEAALAARYCAAAGLERIFASESAGPLSRYRSQTPCASVWRVQGGAASL